MLNINPETVCFLITKAHEFQSQDQVSMVEQTADLNESLATPTQKDPISNPTFAEMKSTINDLEPDQQVELVALMWLGRGDFDLEDWSDALQQAGDSWNARTAEYLIATPLLPDYLEEGLTQHSYSCED